MIRPAFASVRFELALVAFPLLALAACATAPKPLPERLPVGRTVEVRSVSILAPAVARDVDPRVASKIDAEHAADRALDPAVRPDGDFVRLSCTQYQSDAGALAALVDVHGGRSFAVVLLRGDAQRVLDACVAEGSLWRASRPSLRLQGGGTALLATTREHAFVSAFDISRLGDSIVGDPRVATTREGTTLAVRAQIVGASSIALDVTLEQTELVQPVQEVGVRVPGSTVDVVMQIPLSLRQELAASVELATDEVLVLGSIRDGAHDVFVVVDPRSESRDALARLADEHALIGPIERH